MAVPLTIRVDVDSETVFPHGALFLGVEPEIDFNRRGTGDDQKRDDTGKRLWIVRVMDLDPEAQKFGRSPEVKVRIAADVQPVPPAPQAPGFPPLVQFEGLSLTPYVDAKRCTGRGDKCRARQAFSLRATGLREPSKNAVPAAK